MTLSCRLVREQEKEQELRVAQSDAHASREALDKARMEGIQAGSLKASEQLQVRLRSWTNRPLTQCLAESSSQAEGYKAQFAANLVNLLIWLVVCRT